MYETQGNEYINEIMKPKEAFSLIKVAEFYVIAIRICLNPSSSLRESYKLKKTQKTVNKNVRIEIRKEKLIKKTHNK